MKINFQMSGGFAYLPAFSRPFIFDTKKMAPQAAKELESLVLQSRFFEQPEIANTMPRGAADYRTYTIMVEDNQRIHIVQVTDPITDPSLHLLVSRLQALSRSSTNTEDS